jgi:cellulose synthase operon protein YhjQ
MIEKAADQSVTPVDIATLYSRASVQGTRYWDFSASREQVRGQFCHPVAREHAEPAQPQVVREQEERAEPQAVTEQAEPAQPQVVREQEERVEPQAVTEQVEPVEPQVLREQEERVEPQAVTEQAERVEPQVSEQAEAVEQPEALPQGQLEDDVEVPQLEPEAGSEEVLMPEADPPGEMHRMTGSEVAEQPTPAGPTLWAGPAAPREESGPAPLVQWPVPRRQGTGSAAGAGGDTLTLPKEGGPSRWYALQSVFAPPQEAVEAPPTSLEQRPPMVLVFSLAGGVGKTCLVATLGRALSALGERVLLADTSSYGLLPFYFGSREFKPQSGGKGVRTFSPPESESDAPVQVLSLEVERCPGNGSEQDPLLGELVRDGRGANRILVDVATGSRDVTSRLLSLQPTLLVPILPDMSSVASLGSLEAFLASAERGGNEPFYLLNQFDASSPLHLDVREMLRRQLGDRLLPLVLRRSSAVSEALAEGMTVIDYAPSSAAAKDYWDLAGWLRSLDAPAAIGYDELRWSERRAQW